MDYSMVVGIYNLDIVERKKGRIREDSGADNTDIPIDGPPLEGDTSGTSLPRTKSRKTRLAQYSTAIESIQATNLDDEEEEDEDTPLGGIPAKNSKGERLLIFLGIMDILQSYKLKKKIEHAMKAIVIDGDSLSVHRPNFYCQRFLNFMSKRVFKKLPTPIKNSPSKRRHGNSEGEGESSKYRSSSYSEEGHPPDTGTTGRRPDLVPDVMNFCFNVLGTTGRQDLDPDIMNSCFSICTQSLENTPIEIMLWFKKQDNAKGNVPFNK